MFGLFYNDAKLRGSFGEVQNLINRRIDQVQEEIDATDDWADVQDEKISSLDAATKELADVTNNNAKYVAEMEKHYAGRLAKQDQCLIELGGAIDEMRHAKLLANGDQEVIKHLTRRIDKLEDQIESDRNARPVAVLHALAAAIEEQARQWKQDAQGGNHGEERAVRGAKEWLTKNGRPHDDGDDELNGFEG